MNKLIAHTAAKVMFFAAMTLALPCGAEELDSDIVIRTGKVTITRGEVIEDMQRIPEDRREEFKAKPENLRKVIENVLINKTLAAAAVSEKLDTDPEIRRQLEMAKEKLLAQAYMKKYLASQKPKNLLSYAQEAYKVNPDRFKVPELIAASHILISTKAHSKEDAMKLAQEVRAKALSGERSFEDLAVEYSEDPSAKNNKGMLGSFTSDKMVKSFWEGAKALSKPGEISEPVESQFGYHIIKLHSHEPAKVQTFDEVKNTLIKEGEGKYLDDVKKAKLGEILNDPSIKMDEKVVDSLKSKVNWEEVFKPKAK